MTRETTSSIVDRRRFLQGALVAGGAAVAVPSILADEVAAAAAATSDTILVTVTLAGGNDGLNTIGPFTNSAYRQLRGSMAVSPNNAHVADNGLYFHPQLRRLATRYRRGEVAVVQGVGEPLADRSHFLNLARWQSAMPDSSVSRTGWLGRWLDQTPLGTFGALAVGGRGVPFHMVGTNAKVTDLPTYGNALYGSDTSDARDRVMYRAIRRMGVGAEQPWVARVGEVNALAIDAAQAVAPAMTDDVSRDGLNGEMILAARLINLNLGTRVMNVGHNGYDTHDNQISGNAEQGVHAELLGELDQALDSFFSTLTPANAQRVVVLVYSEFGRRVEPNGSAGTDHGTASKVFLIGRPVQGGIYGDAPPLGQLDNRGDLRITMDLRRVYATVLENWLETPSSAVLGASYSSLNILRQPPPPAPPESSDLRDRAARIRARREDNRLDYLRQHSPTF
ncbi:MAG: DUF1501 domain-containing protein [Acidimicrobiales bacterium]|nr:DUF1501 domain-containing protein [Acidimicrobiales bacterium]RZV46479.1 MAG: DUF1501 domain-containing protein [Acidimicrobiales bacterium]